MSSDPIDYTDPVTRCVQTIEGALDEVAGVNPVFLSTPAKRAVLTELARQESRLAALRLSVLAVSADIADEEGSRDVSAWLSAASRQDRGPVRHSEKLAEALDRRWMRVAAGLADGSVNLAQATVVVAALDRLTEPLPPDPLYPERGAEPRRLGPEVLAAAEACLVEACATFAPRELAAMGARVLQMVAPELYEHDELRRLEREEQRASAATRLTLRRRGDGSTDLTGRIPDAVASRLKTYLGAFTAPRHDAHTRGADEPRFIDPTTGRRLPQDRVLGLAFCDFLEAADPARMPIHGGAATKVIVTIDWEALKAERGIAILGDGTQITAGQARRMACTAGILPAVLGGKSEVLDLGREHRLYNTAQRTALGLLHHHCRAEHCTIPATWCEAHHKVPWSHGGKTDLKDGVLLCPWHHQRAHDIRYRHEYLPNGDVRFSRRR